MTLRDVHIIFSGICEYITLHDVGEEKVSFFTPRLLPARWEIKLRQDRSTGEKNPQPLLYGHGGPLMKLRPQKMAKAVSFNTI